MKESAATYGDRSQGYGGLIKISLDQEYKQQRKRDWKKKKKKDDPAFCPPPPPSRPSKCWQIDLLCRACVGEPFYFAFCWELQQPWRREGDQQKKKKKKKCMWSWRAGITAQQYCEKYWLRYSSFLRSLSILSALWIDQWGFTSIRLTHPTQRWCLRVQFILSRGIERRKSFLVSSMFV